MTKPAKAEIPAETILDQPCDKYRFTCSAQAEQDRNPSWSTVRKIGRNGRSERRDCNQRSCITTERDQSACRNTCGRPKYNCAGISHQKKAQARNDKIGHAEH